MQLPTLSNSSLIAQAVSTRAYSRIYDLREPNKDGTAVTEVEVDSLEWIEAIEQGISDFKKAIKSHDGKDAYLQKAFVDYLAGLAEVSKDADLGEFLRGTLTKVCKQAEKQGLSGQDIQELRSKAYEAMNKSIENMPNDEEDPDTSGGSEDGAMQDESE